MKFKAIYSCVKCKIPRFVPEYTGSKFNIWHKKILYFIKLNQQPNFWSEIERFHTWWINSSLQIILWKWKVFYISCQTIVIEILMYEYSGNDISRDKNVLRLSWWNIERSIFLLGKCMSRVSNVKYWEFHITYGKIIAQVFKCEVEIIPYANKKICVHIFMHGIHREHIFCRNHCIQISIWPVFREDSV